MGVVVAGFAKGAEVIEVGFLEVEGDCTGGHELDGIGENFEADLGGEVDEGVKGWGGGRGAGHGS